MSVTDKPQKKAPAGGHRGLDRERLALEIRRAFKPFLVVIVLVVGVLASVSIIFANIGVSLPWSNDYKTSIAVDDASGVVSAKQEVRFAGVVVGRTGSVDLKDGQAIVGIKMDAKDGPLYKDAKVRVRPETPLDDYYVDIVSRGTPAAGKLGEHDVLQAENTHTAVDVGRVLDVFNQNTRTRVEQAIDGYGQGLGAHGADFRETLNQIAPFLDAAKKLTHETAIRKEMTSRLIHNFRLVTEELATRDIALKQLVSAGAGSLGELGANEAQIESTLKELPPTMQQLQTSFATLRATADELDPAFDALQPVAKALPGGLNGLARVGTTGYPAFEALRRPLPQLRSLIGALRPTANSLSSAFTALRPVPARLNYVTGLIPKCEPQLAQFFQHTMSVGKFSDVRSTIFRGEVVVGANSTGFFPDVNQDAGNSCVPGGPDTLGTK
ncbi:MAG: phospholipid/cholesterol/gamma-HCH transport system substrate-binding protein [Solirubrobacteraceae bacterium]|nr:phospholipid/cholesterol/gamma-HCH transport system substrate-binding protein [Solirubrobacteraceae bacterium]